MVSSVCLFLLVRSLLLCRPALQAPLPSSSFAGQFLSPFAAFLAHDASLKFVKVIVPFQECLLSFLSGVTRQVENRKALREAQFRECFFY